MRKYFVVSSALMLFACGGDDVVSGPADAPPLTGDKYALNFGPITVPPGGESTRCVTMRLSNESAIKVHQLRNVLSSGSHHLIVYKDDMSTEEVLTPTECDPFTGALNLSGMVAPIMITQKSDDALSLPAGVAYTLQPQQMIRIEMHYLNATDADRSGQRDLRVLCGGRRHRSSTRRTSCSSARRTSTSRSVRPRRSSSSSRTPSYLDLSAANIFAITGHTHHHGTDMQVRVAPSKTGTMTSVYKPTPFLWSEPETTTHSPGFSVPTGGGFEFECTWTNTSNQQVGFGESANDEMCFFWAYYYPSQGSKVCVHTEQYGGANGLNVCCPGDNTLCPLIEGMF